MAVGSESARPDTWETGFVIPTRHGWLRSGHLGRVDEAGFVFTEDHAKDMALRAGENSDCAEVVAILYELPGVPEAVVITVAHERLGEEIECAGLPKQGSESDVAALQASVEQRLARSKTDPRRSRARAAAAERGREDLEAGAAGRSGGQQEWTMNRRLRMLGREIGRRSPVRRSSGSFVAAMGAILLAVVPCARAADPPGAEVLERGTSALSADLGFDLPQTVGYSVGYHYAPVDRLQIGGELSTLIVANAVALTSRYALHRSPAGRFRLGLQGSVRGVFVVKGDDDEPDDDRFDLNVSWDAIELLVLEPRVAAEWRPFPDPRWRLFGEFGSQHYYGTADGDRLLNGGNRGNQHWGTALRAAAGFAVDLRRGWTLESRSGIWGSFREPLPIVQFGFTKRFGGAP
jgi:hypothetical protein